MVKHSVLMLNGEIFYKTYIQDYIKKLDNKYQSIDEWIKVISPPEKAKELFNESKGRYSEVWHCHCENCWRTFTSLSKDYIYISEDEITILCENCFNALKHDKTLKCKE